MDLLADMNIPAHLKLHVRLYCPQACELAGGPLSAQLKPAAFESGLDSHRRLESRLGGRSNFELPTAEDEACAVLQGYGDLLRAHQHECEGALVLPFDLAPQDRCTSGVGRKQRKYLGVEVLHQVRGQGRMRDIADVYLGRLLRRLINRKRHRACMEDGRKRRGPLVFGHFFLYPVKVRIQKCTDINPLLLCAAHTRLAISVSCSHIHTFNRLR